MTDEPKNPEEAANQPYQPYQPPEDSPIQPQAPDSAWEPEPYTPPTAEPPPGMTNTVPDEGLFAPPSMDASSFPGADPVQPVISPAMQGEVFTPPTQTVSSYTPPPTQTGGSYSPPPASPPLGTPVNKGGTKWWLIILIVVLVLCCCCSVVLIFWFFGDAIYQQFEGYTGLITTLLM